MTTEQKHTPEQDLSEEVGFWVQRAAELQMQRDELAEALRAIVALDDGDKPDLWHFEAEFEAARAALAKLS